jgi:hypothetical protein
MSIKQLCECAGMTREIDEQRVLSVVRRKRREQQRLGGRKLHHMLQAELRREGGAVGPGLAVCAIARKGITGEAQAAVGTNDLFTT